MKYLTQKEVLEVLEGLGLKITVQRFIWKKKIGALPMPDVDNKRPLPVRYYFSTVRKVCKLMAKARKTEVNEEDIKTMIERVVSRRLFKF
jgi:hypothetical protein